MKMYAVQSKNKDPERRGEETVYTNENIDDEEYDDVISNENCKPRAKFNQQELPTLTDDPVYVTEVNRQPIDVLYSEDLTTPTIPGNSTGNLKESPVQKGPVTGNTDHVNDQTAPHAGSPPLPEDRRETLYEEISETRECQEYGPLDEIPIQSAKQTSDRSPVPAPTAIEKLCPRKNIVIIILILIVLLTCVNSILIAWVITAAQNGAIALENRTQPCCVNGNGEPPANGMFSISLLSVYKTLPLNSGTGPNVPHL